MHLAVIDLLLCTVGFVGGIGVNLVGGFSFCQTSLLVIALFYGLSSGTLCLMTYDRFVYISTPLRYFYRMTATRAKLLIAGIWSISFINIIPILTGAALTQRRGPNYDLDIKNCVLSKIINVAYFYWLISIILAFLFITITFNFRILSYARNQSRKIDATNMLARSVIETENKTAQNFAPESSKGTENQEDGLKAREDRLAVWRRTTKLKLTNIFLRVRQRKAMKTIICVVIFHCICNLPYLIFVATEIICGYCFDYKKVKYAYSLYMLNYLNSVLNPVIYTTMNSTLRKAVRKLLTSLCCRD